MNKDNNEFEDKIRFSLIRDKNELSILEENFKPIQQKIEQLQRRIKRNNEFLEGLK